MDYIWYLMGYNQETDEEPKMITKSSETEEEKITYLEELKMKLDQPNNGLRETDNRINICY